MVKKNAAFRIIGVLLSAVLTISFAAHSVFAQCGIHFKTKYQKTLPDLADYQVEDWTGDGKADFWKLQLNPNTNRQDFTLYANDGSGEFAWSNPLTATTTIPVIRENIDAYELIDFNNDGKKDIFFAQGASVFTVYLNNGNNSFTALASNTFGDESASAYVKTVGFFDVNNDNIADWVRLNKVGVDPSEGHVINFRLGSADGTFGARTVMSNVSPNEAFMIGDFNGDNRKDVAYGIDGSIYFWRNNGNGTFAQPVWSPAGFRNRNLIVRDFNGDGSDEIAATDLDSVSGSYTRYLIIFRANAGGSFTRSFLPAYQFCCGSEADYAVTMKTADFNGDNLPDLIEINRNFYSIHLNDGQGGFTRTDYLKKLGEAQDLVFAKLSGDNKADIFVKSNASVPLKNIFNERVIVVRHNQCDTFGETRRANFNGDLLPDVATWNPAGLWRIGVPQTNSDRPTMTTLSFNWGTAGDVPALGDYDGDGKTDYAVYRPGEGNWYILLSSNSGWSVVRFGLAGDVAVPADYNGGGKTDLAVFRPSDGVWYIWFSETQASGAAQFGASGDKPVPADYDGDGKTDIAVYRPSEGNWYFLRSTDFGYSVVHWGVSTDKPVPADYDGDGKADLTVYRDGDWYILRSSNNSFGFIHFGTATDFPTPYYFNRDFAELMVYRASNIFWYRYFVDATEFSGIVFGETQYTPIYFGLPNN